MNPKISITGDLGSGKSSVCTLLSSRLGLSIISVGSVQRELAKKYKLTTAEFNTYMETHPEIDIECDQAQAQNGLRPECLIFDSRLGWHFVPHSFKIYLCVDIDIAAKRVFGDTGRINEHYQDLETAQTKIRERRTSEINRFTKQYNLDISDHNNFDIIINTSHHTVPQIVSVIEDCFKAFCDNQEYCKKWWL